VFMTLRVISGRPYQAFVALVVALARQDLLGAIAADTEDVAQSDVLKWVHGARWWRAAVSRMKRTVIRITRSEHQVL